MTKFPPKRLTIDGDTWTVTMCDTYADVDKHGGEECVGQCDLRNSDIRLYAKMPITQMVKSLFHEVLHALADSRNITCLKKEKYHDDLDQIAVGLANFVIENKLFRGE